MLVREHLVAFDSAAGSPRVRLGAQAPETALAAVAHFAADPVSVPRIGDAGVQSAGEVTTSIAVIDNQVPLRLTLDEDADAAYIYLVRKVVAGGVVRTVTVDYALAMINLDFDADGRLIGVEVVGADRVLPAELTGLLRPS